MPWESKSWGDGVWVGYRPTLDFVHQRGRVTITEEVVTDAVFTPVQKMHSFWESLRNGIESFCWFILKGGWGSLGTQKAKSILSRSRLFHSCWFALFPSWRGRKKLSWFPSELSGEEQSGCYTVSLKLFVQADIGFFGVKISQSPPGSQGLHCAALEGLGKRILCAVGHHMQLP